MSAGPEWVFSDAKHTLAPGSERILVRLGVKMLEMTECLKSWVSTTWRQRAPRSGVFVNYLFIDKAVELLQMPLNYSANRHSEANFPSLILL
jgi:hypothetical protein